MNKYGVPMSHKDKEDRELADDREDVDNEEYDIEPSYGDVIDDSVKMEKIVRSKPPRFDLKDKNRKERKWTRIEKRT